jgi:thioredoxin 1
MKKFFSSVSISLLLLLNGCSNGQSQNSLDANKFSEGINKTSNEIILDVRTPDEFSKGHLVNATNINWNGNEFKIEVEKLDKSKPIYVYCLAGSRSEAAAKKMREIGFKEVYELAGGIMKWRGANLPETTNNTVASESMSFEKFKEITTSDKIVLVDFYADWCGPCRKMKPSLEEISKEMSSTVTVVKINADDNQELLKTLGIDALPVLHTYKNGKLDWNNLGFVEKDEIVKHLK